MLSKVTIGKMDDFYDEAQEIMNKLLSHNTSKMLIEPFWQNIKKKKNTTQHHKKIQSKNFSDILENLSYREYESKDEWINDVNHVFEAIHKQQKDTYFDDIIPYLQSMFEKYLTDSESLKTTEKWVKKVMHYKMKITQYIRNPPLVNQSLREITDKISLINDYDNNTDILNIINEHQPELIKNNQKEIIQLNKLQPETMNALNSYLDQLNL